MVKDRFLLVDGLNNFLRHFCVNPTMNANGEAIGGTMGFLRMLKNILTEVSPTRVIVAWDGKGGSTKRRGIYSEYKAGRKPRVNRELDEHESVDDSRQNLQAQYAKLREYLALLGCAQVEVEGVEADDAIAYLAGHVYTDQQKVVLSTDRDFLQLVSPSTVVYSPTRKDFWTYKNFLQHEGVLAENFIYVKCISGDGSDNVDGIKGVGAKGVTKVLPFLAEKKSSLEEIKEYCRINATKSRKLAAILAGWDVITRNFGLMQLRDPIISAQSARSIRYQVADERYVFNVSELKLRLIKDGVQLTDTNLFTAFNEYSNRFKREVTADVG